MQESAPRESGPGARESAPGARESAPRESGPGARESGARESGPRESVPLLNANFDFSGITLGKPSIIPRLQGFYYSAIANGGEAFHVQLPPCQLKTPFAATDINNFLSGDLLYDRAKELSFLDWCDNLNFACQNKIFDQRNNWFVNDLTLEDIESRTRPLMKFVQQGKVALIRVGVEATGTNKCLVYDSHGFGVDLQDITTNVQFIPLLHVKGIRFSENIFEIVLNVSQMLILSALEKSPLRLLQARTKAPTEAPTPAYVATEVLREAHTEVAAANAPTEAPRKVATEAPRKVATEAPRKVATEAHTEMAKEAHTEMAKEAHTEMAKEAPSYAPTEVIREAPIEAPAYVSKEVLANANKKTNDLEEFNIDMETLRLSEPVILKAHKDVYYDIYKNAHLKAKRLKQKAFRAFLTAKNIKNKYNLPELQDDDVDEELDEEDDSVDDEDEVDDDEVDDDEDDVDEDDVDEDDVDEDEVDDDDVDEDDVDADEDDVDADEDNVDEDDDVDDDEVGVNDLE